nr:integrase, catalytic region, zinc finger, CCHC-type, peptidase aspartic, catalytic [Tanacetum cinerariifolium]
SVATKSELNVARFAKMHVANTSVEARCLTLEAELASLRDKSHQENQGELIKHFSKLELTKVTDLVTNLQAQNDLFRAENDKVKQHYRQLYDSIKITRAKHIEQVTKLTAKNVTLKLVSVRLRDAHLDYLRHLKESVETIRDIVEEAKVVRPLDRSIVSACRYTQHSQELLEYAIGTCPQVSQQRAKQLAHTLLIRKKQVTATKPSDRVYYVEGLGHNLFSVGQFFDSDLEVTFRKHSCYVRDMDGVDLIKGSRGTPQQNDVVKRQNRTLVEAARTTLIFSKALMFLWAEAMATACYTQNRSLIHTCHNKTPYELVHNKKPDLTFFRVFSALCYPTNDSEDLGKLQPTTDIGIFVGYAPSRKVPRTPQQNDVVKRQNRTLVEAARTTLIFSKALMFLWAEAMATACYTQNRSLIHTCHNKTPYELVHNKKPDLTFFRVFSALCYPTNDSEDLGKLQPTTDIGIFVGYAPSRKVQDSLLFSNACTHKFMARTKSGSCSSLCTPINKDLDILFQPMFDEYLEPPRVERPVSPSPAVQVPINSAGTPSSTTIDQDAPSPSHSPSSLALQSLYVTMQDEIHEFDRLQVWELVHQPDYIMIVALKWIYKVKLDEYGDVLENKARLVAKGYRQEEGIDFARNHLHQFHVATCLLGELEVATYRETLTEGTKCAPQLGPEQPRVYSDLTSEEKKRYNTDIQATNILLQGFPKDIYSLINHYTDEKDIWDNNIKMTMSRMQLNSKFVNNMLPEWGRIIAAVKLNRGLRDSNYDQLYAYLKKHEAHANENKMMLDRFTQHTVDLLALMSNNRGQGNNARGAGATSYGGAQNRVGYANPGQARQIKCYNCNGIGHLARNCTQPKRPQNSEYFKDKMLPMQARENGDLALNVDNVFQADDCDAFDSDVDEAPTAQTMFMANLSSANPVYDEAGPSYDSNILTEDVKDNAVPVVQKQAKAAKPVRALMMYPPNTHVKLVPRVLPTKSKVKINIFTLIQLFLEFKKTCKKRITPTGLTEREKGFEQTKECYLTEVIPFFKMLKEHFEGIQKALTKEMKAIFDELEAKVDPNAVNRKCDEIKRKNLLITNDTLIANYLSKEVFYIAMKSELNVSRFSEMHDAHIVVQARCLELETEISKLKDKIQKDDHDVMETRYEADRTFDFRALDFQITQNNSKVHLDYLKHLKESVETLREIVKEAKVERPLDRSLASACLYIKHSQELLEYMI